MPGVHFIVKKHIILNNNSCKIGKPCYCIENIEKTLHRHELKGDPARRADTGITFSKCTSSPIEAL